MLLDEKNCVGHLYSEDKQIAVQFDVFCDDNSSINIQFDDIPFEEFWLYDLYHSKDRYLPQLCLRGKTADESRTLSSSSITLTKIQHKDNEDMQVEAMASKLILESNQQAGPEEMPVLQYHLMGFQCAGILAAETPCGWLRLTGEHNITEYDVISGLAEIKAGQQITEPVEETKWVESCDEALRSVLDILSLSNGRYVEWAARVMYHNETWVSTVFMNCSKRGRPTEPVFNHLHLQPILDTTIAHYTNDLKQRTGMDVAIEWFLIRSLYKETQLITAVTALEHLVDTYSRSKARDHILSENKFNRLIRSPVKKALVGTVGEISEEQIMAITEKIPELNRYPFKNNLWAFLTDNAIPLVGIEEKIGPAIKVRNSVVHKGIAPPNEGDLSGHVAVLRELLVRIFLVFLCYRGEYCSYLSGPQWKDFPLIGIDYCKPTSGRTNGRPRRLNSIFRHLFSWLLGRGEFRWISRR